VAGTDASRISVCGGPVVVLVEPQLGENIGMVARAMLNSGLDRLRLVRPREVWPNDKAVAAASGADRVLDEARLYPSTAAAIADLNGVYATTARPREMTKRVLTPIAAVTEIRARVAAGEAIGLVFGKEATGLTNDDVALADALITAPLNPAFSSLNLGMSVLIVGYEWYQAGIGALPPRLALPAGGRPATKAQLLGLFEQLEAELDRCGFLRNQEKRPKMVRNLRNLFDRCSLTEQEVRTLRGIVTCLVTPRSERGERRAVPPSRDDREGG
jgi:tRNA/rRNA methyltransferase